MRGTTLTVMVPDAFRHAFDRIASTFSCIASTEVLLVGGPAGGPTPNAINNRISAGEYFDVALLPRALLSAHAAAGRLLRHSQTDIMCSRIGLCVAPGCDMPNIKTPDDLRATLLAAPSIVLSAARSGEYVADVLLDRLGIGDPVRARCIRVTECSVGEYVAAGYAPIGFQQVSELLQVPGVRFAGYLPAELQQTTMLSAGVSSACDSPPMAGHFISFLQSASAREILREGGIDPIPELQTPD